MIFKMITMLDSHRGNEKATKHGSAFLHGPDSRRFCIFLSTDAKRHLCVFGQGLVKSEFRYYGRSKLGKNG